MFKKTWRALIFIAFFSLVAIMQFSLINAWPSFFRQINLVLIVLTFTLFFFSLRTTLLALLITSLWLDLFSFNFFGLYFITLFIIIILAQKILAGWLTNRSLYSFLLLIFASTLSYNIINNFLLYFFSAQTESFFLFRSDFWLAVAQQGAWSLIIALLAFSLITALTKRLKPFFLEKKGLV